MGIVWPGIIGLTQNEYVAWEVMPEVFKCSVQEMARHLISQTGHLNTPGLTSHGTDSYSSEANGTNIVLITEKVY